MLSTKKDKCDAVRILSAKSSPALIGYVTPCQFGIDGDSPALQVEEMRLLKDGEIIICSVRCSELHEAMPEVLCTRDKVPANMLFSLHELTRRVDVVLPRELRLAPLPRGILE